MSGSHKPLLFLLGLVVGLLAGAGFFIFKMDEMLKKVNIFYSPKKDTVFIQQQIINHTEEKKGNAGVKKYIGRQYAVFGKDTASDLRYGKDQNTSTSAMLFAKKYSKESRSLGIKKVMAEADSLLYESTTVLQDTSPSSDGWDSHNNSDENFIIKKDELLAAKNFQIINAQQNESANLSDSLLEKISGIKNEKKNTIASLNVEFWQSPINYKGYKMTKNKIVLFGISPEDDIKFYHLDNVIFMMLNRNYYKLYFTDEFKQFDKVKVPLNLVGK